MSEQDELMKQLRRQVCGVINTVFDGRYLTGANDNDVLRGVSETDIIIALVRADMARQLLSEANGYIVARGDDGEAQGAFATLPWMKKILTAIGLDVEDD